MKNIALFVAVLIWFLILSILIYSSLHGSDVIKTWLKDYGSLLSAALAAAITTVYVVITQQQLRVSQQMYRYQFGAGTHLELIQEDREFPPEYRILDAYAYPNDYIKKALPRRLAITTNIDEKVQPILRYEVLRVSNERDNSIYKMYLEVRLSHTGCRKRVFKYSHDRFINGKDAVEIGIWPVENMPSYRLRITGTYQDAIGTFKLTPIEVDR